MNFEKGPEKNYTPGPEEILKQSQFVKEIHLADPSQLTYESAPIEGQLSVALENLVITDKFKKNLEKYIISYLKAPIIKTKFNDIYDKHVFEQDLAHDAGSLVEAFYKSNKLESRNIKKTTDTVEDFAVTMFLSKPEIEDALKEKVAEIREALQDEYEKKPFEAKVIVAEKATELAQELCVDIIELVNKK